MIDLLIQTMCEKLIVAQTGQEGFWVTRWTVESVLDDTAFRSITYLDWNGSSLRVDCIIHDDGSPSSVTVVDEINGGFEQLEVK